MLGRGGGCRLKRLGQRRVNVRVISGRKHRPYLLSFERRYVRRSFESSTIMCGSAFEQSRFEPFTSCSRNQSCLCTILLPLISATVKKHPAFITART